jgi:hypothetical protein
MAQNDDAGRNKAALGIGKSASPICQKSRNNRNLQRGSFL